jgi:hypothetical protein
VEANANQSSLWGFFDPYSLLIRVHAPDSSAMRESLPPAPAYLAAQGLLDENGRACPPEDWSKLLYFSNFVHEVCHYWQHVTRPFTIYYYATLTLQSRYTYQILETLSSPRSLCPRVPLLQLALQAPPHTTLRDCWFSPWIVLESAICNVWGGDISVASPITSELVEEARRQGVCLPDHQLPRLGTPNGPKLTVKTLLENEAFGNEYQTLWHCYGLDTASEVAAQLYGEQIPLEYGGVFLPFRIPCCFRSLWTCPCLPQWDAGVGNRNIGNCTIPVGVLSGLARP